MISEYVIRAVGCSAGLRAHVRQGLEPDAAVTLRLLEHAHQLGEDYDIFV
jgi:hypothetical protein